MFYFLIVYGVCVGYGSGMKPMLNCVKGFRVPYGCPIKGWKKICISLFHIPINIAVV